MITPKPYGRHELKYLLSYAEYISILQKISAVLDCDKHAGKNGYFIRSVYFDDIYESAYYEKHAGIYNRKKYRIRAYNHSPDYITLECKEKKGKKICKTSAQIDKNICDALISRNPTLLTDRPEQVCREFYFLAHQSGLSPSTVVDYHRDAYIHPASNLRITFDKQLHAGGITNFKMFDTKDCVNLTVPVYMNNSVIMELKYDTHFPEFIRHLIPANTGIPLSISKYCLCKDINKSIKY